MLTFNVFDATFEYDESDPEPFRGGQNRFGPKLGATQLGATVSAAAGAIRLPVPLRVKGKSG